MNTIELAALGLAACFAAACNTSNPDGSVVLITSNETDAPQDITVKLGKSSWTVSLPEKSFNTFCL